LARNNAYRTDRAPTRPGLAIPAARIQFITKEPTMRNRAPLFVITAALACLTFGLATDRPTAAQPAAVGRYQIAIAGDGVGNTNVLLCDTQTGQIWKCTISAGQKWEAMTSPVHK
jgi:hypothetical protein